LGIFGKIITKRYENLVEARVAIKHIREIGDEAYQEALRRMDAIKEGSSKVIEDILKGLSGDALKKKCKAIANALKTAINSVYGLTSAKFDNKLRDPNNVDNIVAKYGALFMITLKHKIQEMGYTVVHIKTDSIKIADYDSKVEKFIMSFGKKYGFTFEKEAVYSKMCIVDDAQYIAYEVEADGEKLEKPFWTATGAKFAAPYLFKNLFSHEPVEFKDLAETKSVTDAASL
jgi:DNA polymerase elongation subunit (family B)